MADTLTPREFDDWVPASDAFHHAVKAFKDEWAAFEAITRGLETGTLPAAAATIHWRNGSELRSEVNTRVPLSYWLKGPVSGVSSTFWKHGGFDVLINNVGGRSVTFQVAGVRFDPAALRKIIPAAPYKGLVEVLVDGLAGGKPQPAIPEARHRTTPVAEVVEAPPQVRPKAPDPRGAPPKTIFEDALLAVAHQWHMGDFKPTRQADVQRALAEWLEANGADVGTTAVKERAKKLWERFKD